jgi:catechol 2,3-dioxygenase-like lactoylglutathione lyase family enzyme
MARGSISHISLTVSDLDRSTEFYDRVFKFIGFKRVEVPESTQQAMKTRLKAWVGPGFSISIRPSKGEFAHRLPDRNAPGFNHIWPSLQRTDRTFDKNVRAVKANGSDSTRRACGLSVLARILRCLFH